jgi:glutamate carboxypeptidase
VIELLRELVELESPAYTPGVHQMAERMQEELTSLGAEVTPLDGDHVRAELPGEGQPLLLLGHTDTVWQHGTLARMPFRVEHGRAYGPGAYDMKAGLVVMVEAIRRAETNRALRIFLTADEEHGSRTGRPHLEQAAAGAAAALVVEPPTAEGHLKTARKGLGRFRLQISGKAAHAGTHRHEGASAIAELAHQVLQLEALTDEERGISVNVGVVSGGTGYNVVPAQAEALVDVRIAHGEDAARIEAELEQLASQVEGTALGWNGGWTRPPLEPSPGSAVLFARAKEHGRDLGLELQEASAGGGSDGNLVGALGVPVLDGLGAEGGGAHARDEHVLIESLPVRAELLARLLRSPGL